MFVLSLNFHFHFHFPRSRHVLAPASHSDFAMSRSFLGDSHTTSATIFHRSHTMSTPPKPNPSPIGTLKPAPSPSTKNYFPSQVPAEIRNAIYEQLWELLIGPGDILPIGTVLRVFQILLPFCGVNKQIRTEFGGYLVCSMTLLVSLEDLLRSLATFFPPLCIGRLCQHAEYSTRPKSLGVIVKDCNSMENASVRIIDLLMVKAWVRHLKIDFDDIENIVDFDDNPTLRMGAVLSAAVSSPPAQFLDNIQSGFIRSLVLRTNLADVETSYWEDHIFNWTLGQRKKAGRLTEEERKRLASYCTFLYQPPPFVEYVEVSTVRVQDGRRKIAEEYRYSHDSKTLCLRKAGSLVE